jgi:hypothetical protein
MNALPAYRDEDVKAACDAYRAFNTLGIRMPTETEIDAHNAELARAYRIEEAAWAFIASRSQENERALQAALEEEA